MIKQDLLTTLATYYGYDTDNDFQYSQSRCQDWIRSHRWYTVTLIGHQIHILLNECAITDARAMRFMGSPKSSQTYDLTNPDSLEQIKEFVR